MWIAWNRWCRTFTNVSVLRVDEKLYNTRRARIRLPAGLGGRELGRQGNPGRRTNGGRTSSWVDFNSKTLEVFDLPTARAVVFE